MTNKIIKVDTTYLLEEIWACEPDEPLHNIFSIKPKRVHLQYTEELLELAYYEDNGNIIKLEFHKIVVIYSMRDYITYFMGK